MNHSREVRRGCSNELRLSVCLSVCLSAVCLSVINRSKSQVRKKKSWAAISECTSLRVMSNHSSVSWRTISNVLSLIMSLFIILIHTRYFCEVCKCDSYWHWQLNWPIVRLFGCFCSGDSARKVSFEKVEADRSDVMGIVCVALMSCILLAIVVMDICSLWRRPGRVVVAKQRSPHTHRPIHTLLKTRNRRSRGYALNLHQYWRWTLKGSKFSIVANIALFLVNLQVLRPLSLSYCLHRLRQWTEHFMLLQKQI